MTTFSSSPLPGLSNSWVQWLSTQPFLVLDGGLATEVERAGIRLQGDPLWSARALLDHPGLIEDIHVRYAQAGADILTTASYQASLPGLAAAGMTREEARAVLPLSVRLAENARARFADEASLKDHSRLLVAGSVGPYGAYLADGSEYTGHYSTDPVLLRDFHQERIELLAQAQVDLIACESIPSRHEGEVLLRILEQIPEIPAWISFTCRNSGQVSHGERFRDCAAMCADVPHILAGINCVAPGLVSALLASASDLGKPMVIYANRGEIWDADRNCWREDSGLAFAHHVQMARDWVQYAGVIGGCCRTTPEFTASLTRMRTACRAQT